MTKTNITLPEHPYSQPIGAILQFLDDQGLSRTKQMLELELKGQRHVPLPENAHVLLDAMSLYDQTHARTDENTEKIISVKRRIYENKQAYELNTDPIVSLHDVHASNIVSVCWHPDGTQKRIASGSSTGEVRITDVSTQETIFISCLSVPILSMTFNPVFLDILAIGCFDGTLHILNVSSSAETSIIKPFSHQLKRITCVRFSENGSILASASADNTVALYKCCDMQNPTQWVECHRLYVVSTPESLCWMNSVLIVAVRDDHQLHFYDSERNFEISRYLNMNTNADDYCSFNVLDLCVGNSESFQDICVASTDKNRAILLSATSKGPIFSFYGAINDEYSTPRTSLSWNDSSFFSTSQDNTVVAWDIKTQRIQSRLASFSKLPRDLSVSTSSGELAVCSYDRSIRVFACDF